MRYNLIAGALAISILASAQAQSNDDYQGSRFEDVWQQVTSDPYFDLPQYEVTFKSFFDRFQNVLLENSKRTLNDDSDVLPYFDKLVHPNGICLKGRWVITEDNPYSGYFAAGSEALIIARASTALTNTKRNSNRAFGLAGKLYPTNDPLHEQPLKTANFFTIEDLGGSRRDFFLDAKNTNDIIKVSPSLTAFLNGLVGAAVAVAFPVADESNLQTALLRELYPIAELGLGSGEASNAPIWMRITGSKDMPRILADDFRDELNIANYPDNLVFDIEVASKGSRFGKKQWQTIGYISFDDSIVSESCDHRLHFAHPKSRKRY